LIGNCRGLESVTLVEFAGMKFALVVEGRNWTGLVDGEQCSVGFVTTRVVEARSLSEESRKAVIEEIKEELAGHGFEQTAATTTSVIREEDNWPKDRPLPEGFTFFIEE
jgi:hypothetical protein